MIFRAIRHTIFSEWAAWIALAVFASILALAGIRLPGSLLAVLGIVFMIAVYLMRYGARGDKR